MDKMREDFEAWFCSTIPYQIAKSSWFAIMDDGDYIITDVQASWAAWKASRTALCVELPKPWFDENKYEVYDSDEVKLSLSDAGVEFKYNKPLY